MKPPALADIVSAGVILFPGDESKFLGNQEIIKVLQVCGPIKGHGT